MHAYEGIYFGLLQKPTDLDLQFAIKNVNLYGQSGSINLIG